MTHGEPKPSARPQSHHPQVTGYRLQLDNIHFLDFFELRTEARNGRLLFWYLTVLHLYSLTSLFGCLVLTFGFSRVKKELSLFKFFDANFEHSCNLLSSRVLAERAEQASW